MEPENDPKLRQLLREWEVGGAPKHLDAKVLGSPKQGWRFWLQGSIRIPVPLGLAAVALLVALTSLLLGDRPKVAAQPDAEFNLTNFQPVANVRVEIIGGERVP